MKIRYFVAIASVFTNIYALEPGDVTYDGSVLNVPYVRVGDIAYELKLAPTSNSTLNQEDCQILCVKLLSAEESSLTDARNPATFDGTTLSTPRVILKLPDNERPIHLPCKVCSGCIFLCCSSF